MQKKIKEPAIEPEAELVFEPVKVEPVKVEQVKIIELKIRCINCGQNDKYILQTGDLLYCPACGHNWTAAEESSPFRRHQRGQL